MAGHPKPPPARRETVAIRLRPPFSPDAPALLELRSSNREFFEPWEPLQSPRHFTLEGQLHEIAQSMHDRAHDRRYVFLMTLGDTGEIVGRVALSNVARGAWQSATIGYYVARDHNGRGYATDGVRKALRFAFEDAGLHRVQGAVIRSNVASLRVLQKTGFRSEGVARRYLQINGEWRDHEVLAITREDWDTA